MTAGLKELLARLQHQQRRRPLELVVVDELADAATSALASQFSAALVKPLPEVTTAWSAVSAALPHCVAAEVIVVSPHLTPEKDDWVERLLDRLLGDKHVAAASSRVIPPATWVPDAFQHELDSPRAVAEPWLWGGFPRNGSGRVPHDEVERFAFHLEATVFRRELLEKVPLEGETALGAAILWALGAANHGYFVANAPEATVLLKRPPSFVDVLRDGYATGRAGLESGTEPLYGSEVFSRALWKARGDWEWIAEDPSLTESQREHARMASVVRRTMEMTGVWIGAHGGGKPASTSRSASSHRTVA